MENDRATLRSRIQSILSNGGTNYLTFVKRLRQLGHDHHVVLLTQIFRVLTDLSVHINVHLHQELLDCLLRMNRTRVFVDMGELGSSYLDLLVQLLGRNPGSQEPLLKSLIVDNLTFVGNPTPKMVSTHTAPPHAPPPPSELNPIAVSPTLIHKRTLTLVRRLLASRAVPTPALLRILSTHFPPPSTSIRIHKNYVTLLLRAVLVLGNLDASIQRGLLEIVIDKLIRLDLEVRLVGRTVSQGGDSDSEDDEIEPPEIDLDAELDAETEFGSENESEFEDMIFDMELDMDFGMGPRGKSGLQPGPPRMGRMESRVHLGIGGGLGGGGSGRARATRSASAPPVTSPGASVFPPHPLPFSHLPLAPGAPLMMIGGGAGTGAGGGVSSSSTPTTDLSLSVPIALAVPHHSVDRMVLLAEKVDHTMETLFEFLRYCDKKSQQQSSSMRRRSASGGNAHPPVFLLQRIYDHLSSIFFSQILKTYRLNTTQFLVFFACSLGPIPILARKFVGDLLRWGGVSAGGSSSANMAPSMRFGPVDGGPEGQVRLHLEVRRCCLAYLASFLARAKFLRVGAQAQDVVIDALRELLEFAVRYIHTVAPPPAPSSSSSASSSASSSSSSLDVESHAIFYHVCQAMCYVLCFRMGEIMAIGSLEQEFRARIAPGLVRVIESHLNPFRVIPFDVVQVMQTLFHRFRLRDFSELIRRNRTVVTRSPHHPRNGLLRNDVYFPFDPYVLRRSKVFVVPIFQSWGEVKQQLPCDDGGLSLDAYEDEEDELAGEDVLDAFLASSPADYRVDAFRDDIENVFGVRL